MIWTRENLKALLEKDLCLKVLIPLFRAMGYHDVRYYHGGIVEQGKDIVMWKHDDLKGRVNYAAVVKADKITGSVANVSVVAFQAQQALGDPFVDEITHETHAVHEVFIITSHEITKEGHESLRNSLAAANGQKLIHKIDGNRLWELVEKYLPHETIFSTLADATKALEETDPDFEYLVETSTAGTRVTFFPKQGRREAVTVRVKSKFPDTPEGKENELALRRFVSGGQAAQVKAEYLSFEGIPALLSKMLQDNPDGVVSLGPRRSAITIAASLNFIPFGTKAEQRLFPLIEFGTNYCGTEEVTLGNDQQAIPFKFHLTIRLADSGDSKSENFSFDFTEADSSFFSMLRAQECGEVISRGGSLVVRDHNTERKLFAGSLAPNPKLRPGRSFLELLRKLVWIQRQLNVDITPPQREIFEEGDIEEILSLETILRTGRFRGDLTSLNVSFKPGAFSDLVAKNPNGLAGGGLKAVQEYNHELLGTEIALGPVDIFCKNARLEPDLKTLAAHLPSEGSPAACFVSEDGTFDAKFRNWPKPESDEATPTD